MFTGFTEDTIRFFWELAFHNEKAFYEANRDRYKQNVYEPLRALSEALTPTIRDIDERLNTRPQGVISHIYRDTRYTKDKSPYRDHAWLGYKMPGRHTSECFSIYMEIDREGYGYGMGMYAPDSEMMQAIRARILARPAKFLSLIGESAFAEAFTLEGQTYKRPKYPDVDAAIAPYVNRRSISFCFYTKELGRAMRPEFADEVQAAFTTLKPVYRFLMGLD